MKYLSVFIILCFFAACHETTGFLEKAKKINGATLVTDCMVGRPSSILYVEPLTLLINDRYENKLMTLADISNNYCTRFLQEGNGPDDVMPAFRSFVSHTNQTLGIYQFQTGILNQYNLSDITTENVHSLKVKAKFEIKETPPAAGVVPVGRYFIGNGMFEKGRVHLYDQRGEYIREGGVYPFDGENMDAQSRFFAYQSYMASDDDCKFAIGSAYGDNLEFYEIDEKSNIVLKKKYEARDAQFSIQEGMLRLEEDCLLGYKGIWGGKQYCYLLFSGKTFAENNHRTTGAKYIVVFTWDGEFVKSYEMDVELFSFCVDEKNELVFGIANHEDELVIMQFAL
jgi:hypothetical protein